MGLLLFDRSPEYNRTPLTKKSPSSTDSDDDFSRVRVRLHVTFCLFQIIEAEDPVHERLDAPAREQRHEIRHEPLHRGDALLGAALLVRDAEDAQPFHVHRLEIDFALQYAVDVADDGEPALESERAEKFGKERASDGIDRQVRALAAGQLENRPCEIRLARFDPCVQYLPLQKLQFPRGARSTDHPGAERLRRLQRGDPDALAEARDEKTSAR